MNPRSTDCEANTLTTTPSRRLTFADLATTPWPIACRLVAAFHIHFKYSRISLFLCLVVRMSRVCALCCCGKWRVLSIRRSKLMLSPQATSVLFLKTNILRDRLRRSLEKATATRSYRLLSTKLRVTK